MCVNKVAVKDLFRSSVVHNWFPCGRCPACRQASANRRVRRISSHSPQGNVCYFVTLTYDNKYIPYIHKHHVKYLHSFCLDNGYESIKTPIIRDYDFEFDGYENKPVLQHKVLDIRELKHCLTSDAISHLSGIRTLVNSSKQKYNYDTDKISVSYTPDAQNFIKRLREDLFLRYQKRIQMSYYFAPEYGPTSQRYHLHFLLWIPSLLSFQDVQQHVVKAWPYGDSNRTKQYVEIARSPSRYLASYVNSSDNVSPFLVRNFPLRPSHSKNFGISKDFQVFEKALSSFQDFGRFDYDAEIVNGNGEVQSLALPYPKYLTCRFFPKIKGYSRLTRSALLDYYANFEQYHLFGEPYQIGQYRYHFPIDKTPSGKYKYRSNLLDRYGNPILFTSDEFRYYRNLVERCYYSYFRTYSRKEFAEIVVNWNDARFQWLYRMSQENRPVYDALQGFYNLSDIQINLLKNETISDFINTLQLADCNEFPLEVSSTEALLIKYNKNIKQRKINSL